MFTFSRLCTTTGEGHGNGFGSNRDSELALETAAYSVPHRRQRTHLRNGTFHISVFFAFHARVSQVILLSSSFIYSPQFDLLALRSISFFTNITTEKAPSSLTHARNPWLHVLGLRFALGNVNVPHLHKTARRQELDSEDIDRLRRLAKTEYEYFGLTPKELPQRWKFGFPEAQRNTVLEYVKT